MTALTTGRNAPERLGDLRNEPLAASVKVFGGALVMRNAAGHLTKGATATGCIGVGRAEATVDNSAGAAGALNLDYRRGIFRFLKSGGGDQIAQADMGKLCYIVDDQTVAKPKAEVAAMRENSDIAPDPARFVPVETLTALHEERRREAADQAEARAQAKVLEAVKAGHITRGMRDWALALCRTNEAAFDEFCRGVPTFAYLLKPAIAEPALFHGNANVSDTETAICRQLGLEPGRLSS